MRKIVELKIEETKAIVGGTKAATVAVTAKTVSVSSENKSVSVAAAADRYSM
jgi:hypothetical protein